MRVLERGGPVAVNRNVARQANDPVRELAVSVERPLVAVGVEKVRDSRKALELVAVMALEAAGCNADTRGLELNVSGQQLVDVNRVIRATEAVGQGRFTRADNVPAQRLGGSSHEGLERGA